jgi:glutamate formiminotransferase
VLECVINISEGRDPEVLARLADACAWVLLDLHSDAVHHRSVFTLAGEELAVGDAARALTAQAVAILALDAHRGVHPRRGVVDVVPFVTLGDRHDGAFSAVELRHVGSSALQAREDFARWCASELEVPCFLYGPVSSGVERTLPELRREGFESIQPDFGPHRAHPSAGAIAVGARPALIAYNVELASNDLDLARRCARAVRGPAVRALGLDLGDRVQVSCNLIDPFVLGPEQLMDLVVAELDGSGVEVARAELVGLIPRGVLRAVPEHRWAELGLSDSASIEARIGGLGL